MTIRQEKALRGVRTFYSYDAKKMGIKVRIFKRSTLGDNFQQLCSIFHKSSIINVEAS
jgi:hypothetical protein